MRETKADTTTNTTSEVNRMRTGSSEEIQLALHVAIAPYVAVTVATKDTTNGSTHSVRRRSGESA